MKHPLSQLASPSRAVLAAALGLCLAAAGSPAFAADDVSKVNGSITAEAGQSYGDLDTVNGGIVVDAGARAEDVSTVNGSIRIESGAIVHELSTVNGSIKASGTLTAESINTVNGGIFVDRGGKISKDVASVNGSIGLVDTEVGGSVETSNGNVTVGIGSHVKGGLKVRKPSHNWMPALVTGKGKPPRVVIGPNAVVDGALVFERDVELYVHRSAKVGPITGATPIAFDGNTSPGSPAD